MSPDKHDANAVAAHGGQGNALRARRSSAELWTGWAVDAVGPVDDPPINGTAGVEQDRRVCSTPVRGLGWEDARDPRVSPAIIQS